MIKSNKVKITASAIFLTLQFSFWLAVVITGGQYFISVLISCAFACLAFSKTKSYFFIQSRLIFTVIADVFLVLCDPIIQLPAMVSFSITQICYFLKLYFETNNKIEKYVHIAVRSVAVFVVIIATFAVLKEKTDALSIVSMFYYANLFVNIVFAFIHVRKSSTFAIALLLFILCDTAVGFKELSNGYLSGGIIDVVNNVLSGANWAWIFYVPSQALISFSLIKFNRAPKPHTSARTTS